MVQPLFNRTAPIPRQIPRFVNPLGTSAHRPGRGSTIGTVAVVWFPLGSRPYAWRPDKNAFEVPASHANMHQIVDWLLERFGTVDVHREYIAVGGTRMWSSESVERA